MANTIICNNKENPSTIDLKRAAVLIHSVIENRYSLDRTEINKITDESNQPYPDTLKQKLGDMADAYYYLLTAVDIPEGKEHYTFKE